MQEMRRSVVSRGGDLCRVEERVSFSSGATMKQSSPLDPARRGENDAHRACVTHLAAGATASMSILPGAALACGALASA
eukprot:3062515-Rhodomonas_salina.2